MVSALKQKGLINRPWLGVGGKFVTDEFIALFTLPRRRDCWEKPWSLAVRPWKSAYAPRAPAPASGRPRRQAGPYDHGSIRRTPSRRRTLVLCCRVDHFEHSKDNLDQGTAADLAWLPSFRPVSLNGEPRSHTGLFFEWSRMP